MLVKKERGQGKCCRDALRVPTRAEKAWNQERGVAMGTVCAMPARSNRGREG
jgi:hypothetical protein